MGSRASAEIGTEFVIGGTHEPEPPVAIPEETMQALGIMLEAIKSPDAMSDETLAGLGARVASADKDIKQDTLKERVELIREHIEQAREEYGYAAQRRQGLTISYELVHEVGAQGPGRGLRLYGRYTNKDEQPITFFVYPRDFAIHKLPYQIRNLVQRCAIG